MSRLSFHGCLALVVSLVLFTSSPLLAEKTSPTKSSSKTEAEKYLSKSLDTPLGDENSETAPEVTASLGEESSGSSMTWFFIKVVLGLGVILGGIWLITKVIERSGMAGAGNEFMGVRSTLPLGQNQYLQIVQIGPQYFMLGVTENNVTKLGEITDSETIDALQLDEEESADEGPQGFSDVISNLIGTRDHDFNSNQTTSDYLSDLTSRVSQLNDEPETNQ